MKPAVRAVKALVSALIFLLPVAVLAQPSTHKIEELRPSEGEVEPHSNGYVHRASGYVFPRTLSLVPARKSTTYGPADADVYYTLYGGGNGDGWINLYVYPANVTLGEEAANVTQSIVQNLSAKSTVPAIEIGNAPAGVEEGWFEGTLEGVNLVTGYRVARVGDWFIKARISFPAEADEATRKRLGDAFNAIDLAPTNLSQPNLVKAMEPVA